MKKCTHPLFSFIPFSRSSTDYAITLAHEIGHMVGLLHRDPPAPNVGDGISLPHDLNLEDVLVDPNFNRMDLDLAQATAVQYAKVFQ
jgi:hypothetical protein